MVWNKGRYFEFNQIFSNFYRANLSKVEVKAFLEQASTSANVSWFRSVSRLAFFGSLGFLFVLIFKTRYDVAVCFLCFRTLVCSLLYSYFLRSIRNKIRKHSSMTFLRLKTLSSVYTDEVLIPSTEFFKFMHRLDEGIQSKECAKYLFVTHIFPVFILIDELMWQTKSSS